jgi:hypothetical protein
MTDKIVRLTIEIPESLRSEIKAQAAFKNITIKRYLIQAFVEKIKKDKQYQ